MRKFLAIFILAISLYPGQARAEAATSIPCYCKYNTPDPAAWDAEDQRFCTNEVAFYGSVPNSLAKAASCALLCQGQGKTFVGVASADPEGYGKGDNMVKDETDQCVFFKGNLGGSVDGWSSDYENCKQPLNSIGGTWPNACSFCFCRFHSDTTEYTECKNKTMMIQATGTPNKCPALCESFGGLYVADGPGSDGYHDKCDYQLADRCAKPLNPDGAGCKAQLKGEADKAMAEVKLRTALQARGTALSLPLPLSDVTVAGVIGRMMKALIGIVGAIALLMFVWGGFGWMTAAGSQEKIGKAKQRITWAAIGLIAIFSSYAVLELIIDTFS